MSTAEQAVQCWGWASTLEEVASAPRQEFIGELGERVRALTGHGASATQELAWAHTWEVLSALARALTPTQRERLGVVLEYDLPREGGRRPDLLILHDATLWVVEIKANQARSGAADIDQVLAYARDLGHYHAPSHELAITPVLLPTRAAAGALAEREGVLEGAPEAFIAHLLERLPEQPVACALSAWLAGRYAPLPSLIEAARHTFAREPLPRIKRAYSRGVDACLEALHALSAQAMRSRTHHLVLVTGVPGSGKTLVGLSYVHTALEAQQQDAADALYLTGNDPLVRVLQRALGKSALIKPIRTFYREHLVLGQPAGPERRLVFDEAQRAWDAERMQGRYEIAQHAPGALLSLCSGFEQGCVLVALLGEGQQIHLGEEEGMRQWQEGVSEASVSWQVHGPARLKACFEGLDFWPDDVLDLDTSLRGHLASALTGWVSALLQGDGPRAQAWASALKTQGYTLRMTRSLERARAYCHERYAQAPTKTYGLIASSRARMLPEHGIPNGYMATSRMNVGAWYADEPDSPRSCRQLERCVTEFGCQGLELDMPLLCWGEDLRRVRGEWVASAQRKARDPMTLRLNAYRVLLTRGRDGVVVCVPPDERLDETWAFLEKCGMESERLA